MPSRLLGGSIALLLCGLCSCESFERPATPTSTTTLSSTNKTIDLATRNNALALLDDLLNDEKNLSKILIIKRNSNELEKVVEAISKTSSQGAKMLESFANAERELDLKKTDLPPGETAARKAIAKTKEHLLLHSKDAEFELQLLLTQVDALNYGAHLAQVCAENEPDVDRSRAFSQLAAQLKIGRAHV